MGNQDKLPARIRRAIRHFGNAQFWCGAWQDEAVDKAPYELYEERVKDARAELEAAIREQL